MEYFIIMLKNILVFIGLIALGYILVKTRIIKKEDTPPLSTMLVNVGLPALVFQNSLTMNIRGDASLNLFLLGAISLVYVLIFYFISKLVVKKFKTEGEKASASFCVLFSNSGFLGIPLAQAIFYDNHVIIDYVIVINVINVVLLKTIGEYLFTRDKKTISIKGVILNPAILAFILGLILNALNVNSTVPQINAFAKHLSGLVTPLAMIIVGIKLASINPLDMFKSKKVYIVSFYKLIVQPVVIVAILIALKSVLPISNEIIIGTFIAFATSSAGSATSFADRFGGHVEDAVNYTISTTFFSAITISILYSLIMMILV